MKNTFGLTWWNGDEQIEETIQTNADAEIFDIVVEEVTRMGEFDEDDDDYNVDDVMNLLKDMGCGAEDYDPTGEIKFWEF